MNIFITSGTQGIGEALAHHYWGQGHYIGVCSHEADTFTKSKLSKLANVEFYLADVTDLSSLKKSVSEFVKKFGTLDLMIANAGISYRSKKYFSDILESKKIMEVNVFGVMNSFSAATDVMIPQRSGQLMAMSSVAAYNGLPGRSAYSASKVAVLKYCESLAVELDTVGISVSCVVPGFIKTNLTAGNAHWMPFALTIEESVKFITRGLEKKKFLISFPWPMTWITRILSMLPRSLYVSIMKVSSQWLQDKKDIIYETKKI